MSVLLLMETSHILPRYASQRESQMACLEESLTAYTIYNREFACLKKMHLKPEFKFNDKLELRYINEFDSRDGHRS